MSILIESIEMPKSREDCPLVPVPPHGRLIDADALVRVLKRLAQDDWNKETRPFSWAYAYECEMDVVEDVPTIIPAEPREEETT